MITHIFFDLDGVLADIKNLHFEAFNEALPPEYQISHTEHIKIYDGLTTWDKLNILKREKGLDKELFQSIFDKKQELTWKKLENLPFNENLYKTIKELSKNYKLALCSNAVHKTICMVLEKFKIKEFFTIILSNEDITRPKPHPEIYITAAYDLNVSPTNCLILEDSPHGIEAATKSGCHTMIIKNTQEVNLKNIEEKIKSIKETAPVWEDKTLNILIPMAGAGQRFKSHGYVLPKPLIDINGKPMICRVIDSLNIKANYIFLVQTEHIQKYSIDILLKTYVPNCKIIEVNGTTDGAARTALLASNFIDNKNNLLIVNSDQLIEWNSVKFFYKQLNNKIDASILVFNDTNPKWSFIKEEGGFVTEVAEKNPISDIATVGIYFYKHGKDFVKYAKQMIKNNIRVNNEFYICPVFNEFIKDNKKITSFMVDKMIGLGTPEDLEIYVKSQ